MRRHWKAFVLVETLMLAVFFFGGLVGHNLILAICAVEVGVVALFVTAIAWMRPKGYPPEHHPDIDKIFDDKRP